MNAFKMSARPILAMAPIRGRQFLIGFAALALAIAVGAVAPHSTFAHGTASANSIAWCEPNFRAGGYLITGEHPTSSTSGLSWLAGRVESARNSGPGWRYWLRDFAAIGGGGSYWLATNSSRFPLGQFHNGSAWYRSTTIAFGNAEGASHHRIWWLVQWPDGHQTYVASSWAAC